MITSINKNLLNNNLKIFFRDALRLTLRNPTQALSFLRTLLWLTTAARIREKNRQQGFLIPPILIFSITNSCNLNCLGCYNKSFHHADEKELTDKKLKEITGEAAQLGVSFFVIAGGEPFLRPVLLDIMRDYPQIIFLVFTNGTLINDKMMERFKRQKNVVPMISLEGNQQETDERRGEGTFKQLQRTLKKMNQLNIFFGLSLTLVRKNFSTITADNFIGKCSRLGCKFFLFLEYTPTQPGTEHWILTDSQRAQVREMMKVYRAKYPSLFIAVPWDEDEVGGCLSAGRGFVHISAAGDLEPCPFAPFSDANVRQLSLKQALQSKLLKKIRETPQLGREIGGGCILWKERQLVALLKNK